MLRMLIIAVGLALGLAFPIAHGSHAKNSGNGGSVDEVGEDRQQPEADDDEVDDESAKPPVVAGFTWLRAETFDAGGQRHTVQVYRNDAFANALGLDDDETDLAAEFVLIPAGQLTQGDPERGGQRTVDVKSFLLARTPVTQRVWRGLLGEARLPWSPSRFGGGRRPVERVHWFDARTWCETNGLRLPSDDEWEYACRAGTTTRYYFGDDEEELEEYAWYAGNSRERTHNVGGKSTNAFGLHDMHGNVWEWVDTLYVEQLQRRNKQPEEIQCNGGERPGVRAAPLSTWRITRGGGWDTPARRCRSTVDHARQPGHRGANLGFRAAASLP